MSELLNLIVDIFFLIFDIFVFPGLLGAIFFGGVMSWFNRKTIARFQSRRGPPFTQSWSDLLKLFAKEQIVPVTANRFYFYLGPLIALTGAFLICLLFPIRILGESYLSGLGELLEYGDLVLVITFLLFPAIGLIIGGTASGNPFASIGASREGSMIIAVELPLAIALLTPSLSLIQEGIVGAFNFSTLEEVQTLSSWFIFRFPFAAAAILLCLIVKLGVRPFDMVEARQEIIDGPLTEYSGTLLGIVTITKYIMWFALSGIVTLVFLGGGGGLPAPFNVIIFLIKSFCIIFVISFIEAISARFRIDQAFKIILSSVVILALVDPVIIMLTTTV
ncbi:complex I subunit 1 family protein [Candidatus Hodarchaeum mangrovi]